MHTRSTTTQYLLQLRFADLSFCTRAWLFAISYPRGFTRSVVAFSVIKCAQLIDIVYANIYDVIISPRECVVELI